MRKLFTMLFFLVFAGIWAVSAQSLPKSAYVLNTLGQNLTWIDLENNTVTPDAVPLGLYTNQIKLRGDRAYVINSGVNEIQIIDLPTMTTVGNIQLGSGTNPYNLDFINDSLAAVSLLFTSQVAIVNLNSGQIQQTIPVGTGPEGVLYHDGKIYVANCGFNGSGYDPGTVSVINVATFTVVNTIPVGLNPQDLAIDSQERLLVACTGDYVSVNGQVDVVDIGTGQVVQTIGLTSPITAVAVNAADKAYLATYGTVMVYDLITGNFERDESNPLPGGPGIDFDTQNNAYIVDFGGDSLRVFSETHQKIDAFLVGDGPLSVAIYDPAVVGITSTEKPIVQSIRLLPNYPNPFNPQTHIPFELTQASLVQVEVVNLWGQTVQTLLNDWMAPGYHVVRWNGTDRNGVPVASGIYFYRLSVDGQVMARPMHLIR